MLDADPKTDWFQGPIWRRCGSNLVDMSEGHPLKPMPAAKADRTGAWRIAVTGSDRTLCRHSADGPGACPGNQWAEWLGAPRPAPLPNGVLLTVTRY